MLLVSLDGFELSIDNLAMKWKEEGQRSINKQAIGYGEVGKGLSRSWYRYIL